MSKLFKLYKSLAIEWTSVLGVVVIVNKDIDYLEKHLFSACLYLNEVRDDWIKTCQVKKYFQLSTRVNDTVLILRSKSSPT